MPKNVHSTPKRVNSKVEFMIIFRPCQLVEQKTLIRSMLSLNDIPKHLFTDFFPFSALRPSFTCTSIYLWLIN